MTKQKVNSEEYILNNDGSIKEVIKTEIDIEVPTQEEIITDKESELLKVYEELQKLKETNLMK